jgi:hypothetical protein
VLCRTLIGPSCQRPEKIGLVRTRVARIETSSHSQTSLRSSRSPLTAWTLKVVPLLAKLPLPIPSRPIHSRCPTLILILITRTILFSSPNSILYLGRGAFFVDFLRRHQLLLNSKTTLFVKSFFSTTKFCPCSPKQHISFSCTFIAKNPREKTEQIISYSIPPSFLLDRLFQSQSGYTNIICSNKLSSFFLAIYNIRH